MSRKNDQTPMTYEEEQRHLLRIGQRAVSDNMYRMADALEKKDVMEALRFAANMIAELRTSELNPVTYYELFTDVSTHLIQLSSSLKALKTEGQPMADLYELVQYAGNIVPRLYLLVTVGAVYVGTDEVKTRDLLRDLVEMCRGVQHPTRGLFLRHHLLSSFKDKLPDVETSNEHGNVRDSLDFVLGNFTEMNKLWVRMGHQGSAHEQKRSVTDRKQLRQLVGTNLVVLSNLDGLTPELYVQNVLPLLLDQTISCRDPIAQEYILEAIIRVFPDELHLLTLQTLLSACGKVEQGVDIRTIIITLINRLSDFSDRSPGAIPEDMKLVEVFGDEVQKVATVIPDMPMDHLLEMQVSLLTLAIKVYPRKVKYVDRILRYCNEVISRGSTQGVDIGHDSIVQQILALLNLPLDNYSKIQTVLSLAYYLPLVKYLPYDQRRHFARHICESLNRMKSSITTTKDCIAVLDLIKPLISDESGAPKEEDDDPEEFAEEQHLVARLVHRINAGDDDLDETMAMLSAARTAFGTCGVRRLNTTLVPVIFDTLRVAVAYHDLSANSDEEEEEEDEDEENLKKCRKAMKFVHETISALAEEKAELGLNLFMHAASIADQCDLEEIAFEFISQAFTLYEDQISDSRAQVKYVSALATTLQTFTSFEEDNYDIVVTKLVLYSNKMMKKYDASTCVSLCSHLFWTADEDVCRDGDRLIECLKKARKLAETGLKATKEAEVVASLSALVMSAEKYVHFFGEGVEEIEADEVTKVLAAVKAKGDAQDDFDSLAAGQHYHNIIAHIKEQQAKEQGEDDPEWDEIDF